MVYIVTKADSSKFAAANSRYIRKSVLDNPEAASTETLLTGRWRSCSNGKCFVRTIFRKDIGKDSSGPIRFNPYAGAKSLVRLDPTPCISDLAEYRWRLPLLTAAEEIELIRQIRVGDRWAFRRLLANVHGLVVKTADRHMPQYWRSRRGRRSEKHTNKLFFEDLVAEGCLAVWRAFPGFDLDGGYRFWTYAQQRVAGAISDAARKWRRGGSGEGRLDRWLYSHPHASPEDGLAAQQKLLKRPIYRSLQEAADAIRQFWTWRSNPEQDYATTTEAGYGDDIEQGGPLAGSGPNKYLLARDVARLYDCFDKYKLSPQLRHFNRLSPIVDRLAGEKGEILDRRPGKAKRPKAPRDIRDFSESALLQFKDGGKRKVARQKAASPVRHIEVTPELNTKYLAMLAEMPQGKRRDSDSNRKETHTHDREIRKRRAAATGVRGAGGGRRGNGARGPARPHQPQLHLPPGAGQRPAGTRIASREGGLK